MSSQRISPARIVVILLLPALCVAAEQSEGEAREAPSPPMSVMVSEVEFVDAEPLERVALKGAKFHPAPFVVYYARIEDGNGAHQWTSPIWIDLE